MNGMVTDRKTIIIGVSQGIFGAISHCVVCLGPPIRVYITKSKRSESGFTTLIWKVCTDYISSNEFV